MFFICITQMSTPIYSVTRKSDNTPHNSDKFLQFCEERIDDLKSTTDAYRWIISRRVLHPNHFYEITKHEHAHRWFVGTGAILNHWMITPSDDLSWVS